MCLLVLTTIAVVTVLHAAKPVLLPLAVALVISIMLAPAAARLKSLGLKESVASAIIAFAAIGGLFAVGIFAGKPAVAWAQDLPKLAERARDRLESFEEAITTVKEVSEQVTEIAKLDTPDDTSAKAVVVEEKDAAPPVFTTVPAFMIQLLFTWVLVFFLLSSRTDLKRKLIAVHRSMAGRLQAVRMFTTIERSIGSYMLTMLMINFGVGVVTTIGMYLLGMPNPQVWGLLAAVLNFIPFIGPAALTFLLAVSGIVHFDEPIMAAGPVVLYVSINFLESNFVTPIFLGCRMQVTPLAIIISVSFLTWIWGPVGGLIAIPLLIIFKTVCDSVPALNPVGVFIGELKKPEPKLAPRLRRIAGSSVRKAA